MDDLQFFIALVGILVASSGLEFQIPVEILWIADFCDWNALLPKQFHGENCLSMSAVSSKIRTLLM